MNGYDGVLAPDAILGLLGAHLLSSLLLARFGARMGFASLSDVASLPLLMLLLSLFSFAIAPAALAFSRYHERQADRFGLELTHDNRNAATAFVALQQQNLAIPRPGLAYKIFRASPPHRRTRRLHQPLPSLGPHPESALSPRRSVLTCPACRRPRRPRPSPAVGLRPLRPRRILALARISLPKFHSERS